MQVMLPFLPKELASAISSLTITVVYYITAGNTKTMKISNGHRFASKVNKTINKTQTIFDCVGLTEMYRHQRLTIFEKPTHYIILKSVK